MIRLPSRRSVRVVGDHGSGRAGRGVRFTGRATIKLGKGESSAYNDVMMYVTWYDPEKGNRKRGVVLSSATLSHARTHSVRTV